MRRREMIVGTLMALGMLGCERAKATAPQETAPQNMGSKETPKPRVLMVLTSHGALGDTGKKTGFYLSEVSHPYYAFEEAGFEVDFVSPRGGESPMDGLDKKDARNDRFLADAALVARTKTTTPAASVQAKGYDAIFFAGGHGTMWDLPDSKPLQRLTREIYEAGGVVAAVCHGPAGLVNVKLSDGSYLVAGKRVAGFTNEEERDVKLAEVVPFLLEDRMRARGASPVSGPKFKANVIVDGRLITGQNPASAEGVAMGVIRSWRTRSGD